VVSIIIVNWNSGRLLENCVQSLIGDAAGCQIVIVDNASTDSSLTFLERTRADLSVLGTVVISALQPRTISDGG